MDGWMDGRVGTSSPLSTRCEVQWVSEICSVSLFADGRSIGMWLGDSFVGQGAQL